jgi:hypothetical protein
MRIWQLTIEVSDGEAEADNFTTDDLRQALENAAEPDPTALVEITRVEVKAA